MAANCHVLLGKNDKIESLCNMLGRIGVPDILILTELGGSSGKEDIRKKMARGPLKGFLVGFSQRHEKATEGSRPGAGILIMVNKNKFKIADLADRLQTKNGPMNLEDIQLTDGHLRTWKITAVAGGTVFITVCYIPPKRDERVNTIRKRSRILLLQRVRMIKTNYPGARHIISGHMNCPDGGRELPTSLKGVLPEPSKGAKFEKKRRYSFLGKNG